LRTIAIPAGLLIGLSLGALGGGGSILTVPVLVYLLHQPPHAATAGSLLIVGITATAGMIAHQRAGRVRLGPGIALGVLGVAGAYAGTRLSASIRPGLLLSLFAGLMLVAAAAMLRRRRRAAGQHMPGVFIVAALAGTLAGNRVASRVDASRLTAAFAVLLVAVAAYSLTRSLPGLV
jgi:uncharacterized protein